MDGINIGITEQLLIFAESCLIGVALGLFYDFFRILRKAIPHGWIMIGLEDLLFFIVATSYSFRFMISVLDGKVRFFIIIGELLGWVIYFFSLGVAVMHISDKIIAIVKMAFAIIIKALLFPILLTIRFFSRKVQKMHIFIKRKLKKNAQYTKFRLKRSGILMYNFTRAELKSYRRGMKGRRK